MVNLEVGKNSYVTACEALQYVETHYPSKHALYRRWLSLPPTDQEVLLIESAQLLDMLNYEGRKASKTQLMQFPRRYPSKPFSDAVPEDVKSAQIENALYLVQELDGSEESISQEAFYQSLKRYGISQYRIGNVSETLGKGASDAFASGEVTPMSVLNSPKARQLLRRYTAFGGSIR